MMKKKIKLVPKLPFLLKTCSENSIGSETVRRNSASIIFTDKITCNLFRPIS